MDSIVKTKLMQPTRTLEDITGNKYGRLTVVGRSSWLPNGGKRAKGWNLVCDCGSELSLVRHAFDPVNPNRCKQLSCGCLKKELFIDRNHNRRKYFKGLRVGRLTAFAPTEKQRLNKAVVWQFLCDCGSVVLLTMGEAVQRQSRIKSLLSCSNPAHTDKYLHYPETPNPYPKEAGQLMEKYIKEVECRKTQVYAEARDERMDALIRACWIVVYRRSIGEILSEKYERGFILKWMRYGRLKAFQKFLEQKYAPSKCSIIKSNNLTGDVMTNKTLLDYPDENTRGNFAVKHKKFKRC